MGSNSATALPPTANAGSAPATDFHAASDSSIIIRLAAPLEPLAKADGAAPRDGAGAPLTAVPLVPAPEQSYSLSHSDGGMMPYIRKGPPSLLGGAASATSLPMMLTGSLMAAAAEQPPIPTILHQCSYCKKHINGSVYMLHDLPYCSADCRLKGCRSESHGASSAAAQAKVHGVPPAISRPNSSGLTAESSTGASTGLMATYRTWM